MKRSILFFIAVACVVASCTKGGGDGESEPRIESLTISAGLNGMSTDINSEIDHDKHTISLDRYVADGTHIVFTFTASAAVYFNGRAITSDVTGIDFNKNTPLVVSGGTAPVSYRFSMPAAGSADNRLTAFSLRLTRGDAETYTGTIDQTKRRVTITVPGVEWIKDITSAAATFSTTGQSVTVEGTPQVSGTTKNDFMADVVYTVTAENGDTRDYTVDVVSPQSSGLPVVRVDTDGKAPILNKEDYVTSKVTILDGNTPKNNIVEAAAGVRGRGNSTWGYSKKPYRVKLDKKASVFGLTSAKNWVLLANWLDPTHLMNHVAFELSHRLGMAFTPTITHVEFFLNGSYQGTYTMCEHIQVNEGRVDIDEFEDVFLELDTYFDEPNKFRSTILQMPVMFKSPEFEDVSNAEREAFIANVAADYNAMESAVMNLSGWRDRMDVASFIDFMIVNELVRNTELEHPKSTYLYKEQGGKWTWGPVWDFDWGYGYQGGQNYWASPTSILYTGRDGSRPGAQFFNKLFQDAGFRAEYKARWNAVRYLVSDIDDFVAEMGASLAESDIHNKKVWGSHYTKNYSEQITAMESWLRQRIATLDAAVAGY